MPGLLNAADQRLSDRAVKAAREASQNVRDVAWQVAVDLCPDRADRQHYVAAYLLLRDDVMWDENSYDVVVAAGELAEVTERYEAAILARRNGDG